MQNMHLGCPTNETYLTETLRHNHIEIPEEIKNILVNKSSTKTMYLNNGIRITRHYDKK